MSIGILPACGSSVYRYRAYQIQSQRGLASLRRHSCLAGACGAMLSCGSLRLSFFVGAIAVVAVGAAEPSVVVDGTALVFRLPRFLYGRGDP